MTFSLRQYVFMLRSQAKLIRRLKIGFLGPSGFGAAIKIIAVHQTQYYLLFTEGFILYQTVILFCSGHNSNLKERYIFMLKRRVTFWTCHHFIIQAISINIISNNFRAKKPDFMSLRCFFFFSTLQGPLFRIITLTYWCVYQIQNEQQTSPVLPSNILSIYFCSNIHEVIGYTVEKY